MRAAAIKDIKKWHILINRAQNSGFLNTPAFHNLWQTTLGEKIWRRGVFKKKTPYLIYNIIKKNLPYGFNFLFIAQGPLFCQGAGEIEKQKAIEIFFEDIKALAMHEKSFFIKIEPMYQNSDILDFLSQKGFIKSRKTIEPQYTTVIDLQKTETDLFNSFHHKARYNIRLAKKYKVAARLLKDKIEAKRAIKLILETARSKHFGLFRADYFEHLLSIKTKPLIKVFGAFYQNKIIASSINLIFKKRATYLFGGFDLDYRQVMASYLLKWEEIKYFKNQGCQEYDLWGICDPKILKEDTPHALKGVTAFKTKFNGKTVQYPGSFDYIINRILYYLYLRLS